MRRFAALSLVSVLVVAAPLAHADDADCVCGDDAATAAANAKDDDPTLLSIGWDFTASGYKRDLSSASFGEGRYRPHWSGASRGIYAPTFHTYGIAADVGFGAGYYKFRFDGGSGDGVTAMRVAMEGGAQIWFFDQLRVQIGAILGMEMYGAHDGTAVLPWIQPRLATQYLFHRPFGLGVGVYIGDELTAPRSVETGISVSLEGLFEGDGTSKKT